MTQYDDADLLDLNLQVGEGLKVTTCCERQLPLDRTTAHVPGAYVGVYFTQQGFPPRTLYIRGKLYYRQKWSLAASPYTSWSVFYKETSCE